MADELSAPLAKRGERNAARRSQWLERAGGRLGFTRLPLARLAFLAIVVVLAGVTLRMVLVDDPDGGRPSAEVPINSTRDGNTIAEQVSPSGQATITADPEPVITIPGGPSITTFDETPATGPGADEAALESAGIAGKLAEETENGPIPRIATDGTTPFFAYARPTPTVGVGGKARIAIIVTGLGLNEAGTLEAVAALPDAVTLAFAPYGRTLDRTVGAARAEGHELLLEVPLEPFDYPDNDPGPETLLTGHPPRANMDKLYWLMARFGGYLGIINNMGARFTSSGADFSPLMEELGARGLGYIDDGTSNRSLAPQLAAANNVPFARGSVQLDGNPARAPIMAALADLEAKANEDGAAIGIASALPVSIQTLAEWAKGLEDRGFILVPVSSLMKAGS